MKRYYLTPLLLVAALCSAAGCIGTPVPEPEPAPTEVEFSTAISKTRAHDNLWEGGDLIGVYMVPLGNRPRGRHPRRLEDGRRGGHNREYEVRHRP